MVFVVNLVSSIGCSMVNTYDSGRDFEVLKAMGYCASRPIELPAREHQGIFYMSNLDILLRRSPC